MKEIVKYIFFDSQVVLPFLLAQAGQNENNTENTLDTQNEKVEQNPQFWKSYFKNVNHHK